MEFILLNCTPKLKTMGIDPTVSGWEQQLSTKLTSYINFDSWSYSYETDTLSISPVTGTSVSLNLTDFGDAGGIMP